MNGVSSFVSMKKMVRLSKIKKASLLFLLHLLKNPSFWIFVFFATLYSAISVIRHVNFQSTSYDLGIYDQMMWHFSKFQVLADSSLRGIKYILADHFNPGMVLLAPFYWFWNDARMLLILQAVAVSLTAIPIYKIAFSFTKEKAISAIVSISCLIFPGIQWGLNFDAHPIAFAVPCIAFAFYFLIKDRLFLYFLCILAAMLFKEDMFLFVLAFGLYTLLVKQNKYIGIITFFLGILYYLLVFRLIYPVFFGCDCWYTNLYQFEYNPVSLVKTLFDHPSKIATWKQIGFSFGFLPFFLPLETILWLPAVAENFFITKPAPWHLYYHHWLVAGPLFAIASLYSIRNIAKIGNQFLSLPKEKTLNILIILMCLISLSYQIRWNRLYEPKIPLWNQQSYKIKVSGQTLREINEIFSILPDNASVSATDGIISHLAHRDRIYRFPEIKNAEYVILMRDQTAIYPFEKWEDYYRSVQEFIKEDKYGLVVANNSVLLFEYGCEDRAELTNVWEKTLNL